MLSLHAPLYTSPVLHPCPLFPSPLPTPFMLLLLLCPSLKCVSVMRAHKSAACQQTSENLHGVVPVNPLNPQNISINACGAAPPGRLSVVVRLSHPSPAAAAPQQLPGELPPPSQGVAYPFLTCCSPLSIASSHGSRVSSHRPLQECKNLNIWMLLSVFV